MLQLTWGRGSDRPRPWGIVVVAVACAVCVGLVVFLTTGSRYFSVLDYGAKGDGTADDAAAIQACIAAAAAADKEVYFPAGTYRIASTIELPTGDPEYDNLVIRGAGVEQTIITMDTVDAQSAPVYMYSANNLSGVHISDMTFRTPAVAYPTNVNAIITTGMQNSSLKRITIENCDYGIKLGGGEQAHSWDVEDIVTRNIGILSLQPINVSDSVFRNLDLQNRTDTGEGMCVYIERDCHDLRFENLSCVGGSRNCMQLYSGYGTNPSDRLTFVGTYLDHSGGPKYPLTVDGTFSDVTFTNSTIIGNSSENPCIVWYGGTRVVFDGITASGGAALHMQYGTTAPVNCQIRNGTYTGSTIGSVPGVTLTAVTLAPTTTTLAPTTTMTAVGPFQVDPVNGAEITLASPADGIGCTGVRKSVSIWFFGDWMWLVGGEARTEDTVHRLGEPPKPGCASTLPHVDGSMCAPCRLALLLNSGGGIAL